MEVLPIAIWRRVTPHDSARGPAIASAGAAVLAPSWTIAAGRAEPPGRLNRTPFSLFFLAPVLLPQQTYRLTYDGFAEPLDIFLVPSAQDANGVTDEAVFT